ncbi:unnamed protein product [Staurois parvus]|uniref:Uncharacterized protein n=1 Tax=Staurois parvus TaxID=386267 RepID=A0ABN9AD22_9NEOB|nr:unnamed protein product [Staurois parvus]
MGRSQELNEFKCGTVIGCHLCEKSIPGIYLLLNIPLSTVSGIITKWKQLGTTGDKRNLATKWWARNMTERDQRIVSSRGGNS